MGARKGRSKSPGKRTGNPKSPPSRKNDKDVEVAKSEKKKTSKDDIPVKTKKQMKQKEVVEESSESEDERHQTSDDSNEEPPKNMKPTVKDDDEDDSDSDENQIGEKKKGKPFSDENAKWLKPKKADTLISSDEESDDSNEDGSESEDDEMEVEKQSRLLDTRKQEEDEDAEEEFRETVSKHTSIYHLPNKEELEMDVDRVVPPSELKSHINSILEALADFKTRREPGRARSEYVDQLGIFIAELYGYLPELVAYFLTMFSPAEALEFIDYSDKQRPMVIRTNTLKTRRKDLALALMKRGVTLDPLASWSKVGLKIIESTVPIGATPEYLSGHYMLQSAASMCPVLALAPEPNERILDMSAAPGGKTSYIAQLMRNTGVVFANDLKADRQKATAANMHRLGVKNVITCCYDGRKLPKLFQHYKFDRILLDAPCSGLGVISRDPSCKVQRTLADVNKTAHLQKELILAAIDTLNHKSKSSGGVMVYSTCSVSVAENEEVVNYALQKRDIKIIDSGLDFGKRLWILKTNYYAFRPRSFCVPV
jgi:ribosomal RNA methyltransferase Nop2